MNNNKQSKTGWVSKFFGGKGFYIALFLCVAAIGISCYYLYTSFNSVISTPDDPAMNADPVLPDSGNDSQSVFGDDMDIYVPDTKPVSDVQDPEPITKVDPEPAPEPAPEPEPEPVMVPEMSNIFVWPVSGFIIGEFKPDELSYNRTTMDWRAHLGVDIAADVGSHVLAISSGTILSVEDDAMEGTCVTIDHGNGLISRYTGLASTPAVSAGDDVLTGDVIGAIGTTALIETIETPHLHFEMTLNGIPVNPADYLPQMS